MKKLGFYLKFIFFIQCKIVFLCFCVFGCGVKGDPLPPEKPPELGRGKPSYNRATQGMAYPDLPPIDQDNENQTNEEDEDGKRTM